MGRLAIKAPHDSEGLLVSVGRNGHAVRLAIKAPHDSEGLLVSVGRNGHAVRLAIKAPHDSEGAAGSWANPPALETNRHGLHTRSPPAFVVGFFCQGWRYTKTRCV